MSFHKGLIVRKGLLGWTRALQTMPVRWRIRSALMAFIPAIAVGALLLGLSSGSVGVLAGLAAATAVLPAIGNP